MGKLGYSTLTLTDLTEAIPISLVLQSDQKQNIQIKIGDLFDPNFDKNEGEELIITPSLFLGSEKIDVPYDINKGMGYIYYQTGEIDENGIEIKYFYDGIEKEIYVDEKGRLHYGKNLTKNLTIEAYLFGFKNKENSEPRELISAQNSINILLLEQGLEKYTLSIQSEDKRDFFSEENNRDIKLIAQLWKGAEKITENVKYVWDIVSDVDTEITEDDYQTLPKVEFQIDFHHEGAELTIQREMISNIEIFQCSAILEDGSNLPSITEQKIIRDFTDNYTNQLIASNSLILTPQNSSVTLTNQVWYQTKIINEGNTNRFTYEWFLLKKDTEEKIVGETGSQLIIDIGQENSIYPKENFSILGKVIIDNKAITINYADIKYQPISYSVNISPKTIFIPVTSSGEKKTDNFIQEIKFQLLDENKNPLLYNPDDSAEPVLSIKDNDTSSLSCFREDESKWNFELSFSLDMDADSNDFWKGKNSKTYEFSYKYLNEVRYEEFEIIKNYAGDKGDQGNIGFSGITVDLTNSFHAFSGGEAIADPDQNTNCQIQAFYGAEELEIQSITVNNGKVGGESIQIYSRETEIETEEQNYIEYRISEEKGFLFIGAKELEESKSINVLIRTNSSEIINEKDKFLKGIEPIYFNITVKDKKGQELKYTRIFSYTINYNGKSYNLEFYDGEKSCNNILYSTVNNTFSPSQITVSPSYRETSGEIKNYNNGFIFYSYDGDEWFFLGRNSAIFSDFSERTNIEKIYLRLYSNKASLMEETISGTDLKNYEEFLLDVEDIPILTSLEGYQIGGENLIKWSKTIPIETNKWYENNNNNVVNILDGDFTTKVWSAGAASSLVSPKISYAEEYAGKTFCLSFYIKRDNLLNSTASGSAHYLNVYLTSTQLGNDYTIGSIYAASSKDFIIEEGEGYQKAYALFNFPSSVTSDFYIRFGCRVDTQGTFSLKKPKLELGNIPSAWSASPYDIDFSDVSGTNLFSYSDSYRIEVYGKENGYVDVSFGPLPANDYYTFSWKDVVNNYNGSKLKEFFIELYQKTEDGEIKDSPEYSGSYAIGEENSFTQYINFSEGLIRIYANNSTKEPDPKEHLIFYCLKAEKGSIATPYTLDSSQIANIVNTINEQKNSINNFSETYITLDTLDGKQYVTSSELTAQIEASSGSYVKTDNLTGIIEAVTNDFITGNPKDVKYNEVAGYFKQIQRSVKIVTSGLDAPYIQIGTYEGDQTTSDSMNFYTRITDKKLSFCHKGAEVAYISDQSLMINKAQFLDSFTIGNFDSGILKVSVTSTGVGFLWEV